MEENIGTKSIQILNNFFQKKKPSPIRHPAHTNTDGDYADAKSYWSCRAKNKANRGRQLKKKLPHNQSRIH